MFIIADNISTRCPEVDQIFRQLKSTAGSPEAVKTLQGLAQRCAASGADMLGISLQQRYAQPGLMEAAVKAIQQVTDRQLCLSTNNTAALEAGLQVCKHFPLVNYISVEELRLKDMLPLAAKWGAEVVLLTSDPAAPTDAREMLEKAAVLVGAANEVGIPNDSLWVDPGLIHITHDVGQRHLVEVKEFLSALPELFDPPVKSTCWLSNISTGAPLNTRPILDTTLLAVLSSLGLSSVFMDVLSPENMRMVRLLKIFNNEEVYSDGEIELAGSPATAG